MRASDFTELWSAIARPPRGRLVGRRVAEVSPSTWVAIDAAEVPHLLIEVEAGASVTPEQTRALDVTVDEMRIGEEPTANYVALACLDATHVDTFAALCAELVAELARSTGRDPCEVVARTIAHWRRFWSVPRGGLSRQECLGLFGELWFLERWIGSVLGVGRWTGAEDFRHDFQWEAASVEVKTTSAAGPVRHQVNGIDQLADPEVGELYLFSLLLTEDELAANTLGGQVRRIEDVLRGEDALLAEFRDKLGNRGFNPGDEERYPVSWRVVGEELYRVGEGFPRLTRESFVGGVPVGVSEVVYVVEMAAAAGALVATAPSADGTEFLAS